MSDSSELDQPGDGQHTGSAPVGGTQHGAGDLSTLVGLTVQVAVAEVKGMGLHPRVVDESVQAVTAEYQPRRVNLYTVGGVVRRVTAG